MGCSMKSPGPIPRGDIVLRLLDGRSDRRELVLESQVAIPPITLGSSGSWSIEAGHVAKEHVRIAFNGTEVFVGLCEGELGLLDGFPIGRRWREVKPPSELRFGSARLTITRRPDPDEITRVPMLVREVRTEDATCFDEDRLQAALRLSRNPDDDGATDSPLSPSPPLPSQPEEAPAAAAREVTVPYPSPARSPLATTASVPFPSRPSRTAPMRQRPSPLAKSIALFVAPAIVTAVFTIETLAHRAATRPPPPAARNAPLRRSWDSPVTPPRRP